MSAGYEDVVAWIREFASQVEQSKQYLTKLDAAIGDGDHGLNMDRGMRAALEKIESTPGDDIGALLKAVGMTLVSKVGGAGGPLYGTFFIQLGTATSGQSELEAEDWGRALDAAVRGVQARGKAELEDKTMMDALIPAREAFNDALQSGTPFAEALERSAAAAEEGVRATVPLVAKKGRASYLGERSAGHQDPGATSAHMLLQCAARSWGNADT